MEQQADRCPGQNGSMPAADSGSTREHSHGGQGVREGASLIGPQQPKIEGYVIQVNSHGRNQSREVEAGGTSMKHARTSKPRAAVARWATSSSTPVLRRPN